MRLSDRTKTSMILTVILLAAAALLIPWGQSTPPGEEYPVSTLDLSTMKPAEGVTLTVADVVGEGDIELTLTNTRGIGWYFHHELVYGKGTFIELKRGETWYVPPLIHPTTAPAIQWQLRPADPPFEYSYSRYNYDPPLVAGDYRMIICLSPTDGDWDDRYYVEAAFRVLPE